jgi:NDP-sugar pyrophosphorylase family protein
MIDKNSLVEGPCEIGPFVYIGEGAKVQSGARLKNSVVYAGAKIAKDDDLENAVVL